MGRSNLISDTFIWENAEIEEFMELVEDLSVTVKYHQINAWRNIFFRNRGQDHSWTFNQCLIFSQFQTVWFVQMMTQV